MPSKRLVPFALSLLLLAGCVSLSKPDPLPPVPAKASVDLRKDIQHRFSVRHLGPTTFESDGKAWLVGYLPDYLRESGSTQAAGMARRAAWHEAGSLLLALGAFAQPILAQVGSAPDAVYGAGALGLMALAEWVDLGLARPQRVAAVRRFNADVAAELGLPVDDAELEATDPGLRSGWRLGMAPGVRSVGNRDLRDYFGASWPDSTFRHNHGLLSLGWMGQGGWGWDLGLGYLNWGVKVDYSSGAKQRFDFDVLDALLSPGYTFRLGSRVRTSLTLSADLGYAWLRGLNQIRDSADAEIGHERIHAAAPAGGLRLRVRRPMLPAVALGVDMGYRWNRFGVIGVSESQGSLLNAQPGRTWVDTAQTWDLSGPFLSMMIEFGRVPFGR